MSQFYTDPSREDETYALPNGETFYVGTLRNPKDPLECPICNDWAHDQVTSHSEHVGWYYWACFPGCLPDGEPIGPFETEDDAILDAQEDEC